VCATTVHGSTMHGAWCSGAAKHCAIPRADGFVRSSLGLVAAADTLPGCKGHNPSTAVPRVRQLITHGQKKYYSKQEPVTMTSRMKVNSSGAGKEKRRMALSRLE
jgi:hypothetical protein